jgi:hypothetical protein
MISGVHQSPTTSKLRASEQWKSAKLVCRMTDQASTVS